MTRPVPPDQAVAYSVSCRTCGHNVWSGNTPPTDGQPLLIAYAESTPGPQCPSKRATARTRTPPVPSGTSGGPRRWATSNRSPPG